MIDHEDIKKKLIDLESDLIERKEALSDKDRVQQAVCAYANDLPDHRSNGYIFIGVTDSGDLSGLAVTDRLLLELAGIRDSGKILPVPHLDVQKVDVDGRSLAMIRVHPSDSTPVRFEGRVWIRVGPRRAIATAEEERRLTEKNVAGVRTFDRRPCMGTSLDDLLIDVFKNEYLPGVVSRDVIQENHRETKDQLASLRMFDLRTDTPTNAGNLILGRDPLEAIPGAYIQFVRYDGASLVDDVIDHKELSGNLMTQLRQLDELLPLQVRTARESTDRLQHRDVRDYPMIAIREVVLNAVMHRTYEGTNAPIRIDWFSDRVEVLNPGGLFGHVTPQNFRRASDYRNPVIAEAMKGMGYVERFGVGVSRAYASLMENGNPPPDFTFEPTHVLVTVRAR